MGILHTTVPTMYVFPLKLLPVGTDCGSVHTLWLVVMRTKQLFILGRSEEVFLFIFIVKQDTAAVPFLGESQRE